ncbi:MAG: penicillin acylase family protein [Actinobacteria bacterium]|nr:MAG: penicillin acylase family protein [Actinomycetota bacterium]
MRAHSVPLGAAVVACLAAGPAMAKDYSSTARNIIPSGQYGNLPTAKSDAQAKMYDALTPLFDKVNNSALNKDFKSEKLGKAGTPGPATVEKVPRKGVRIVRDKFDVPHVYGKTHDDVVWAAGWILEEDRSLLLAQGRYPARFAALDAPGISAINLIVGLKQVKVTAQADQMIESQSTALLKQRGKPGRALLHDIDTYVKGINARLKFERSTQAPFTRADIYAFNAVAGQLFGRGGGDEARRAQFLSGLTNRLGDSAGNQLFDDLAENNDADAPATQTRSAPYEAIPSPNDRTGNAIIDADSFQAVPATQGTTTRGAGFEPHRWASNFLMVSGKRSGTRHPLFVAGPQIGYYYPGLTDELDLHGPGYQARGASSPAQPGSILIGRGPDFAWSLTSAGSDTTDDFVETLCDGSDTKYLYKGQCRDMETVDAGMISGQGEVVFRRTIHGPVVGYATVGGTRVAVSQQRSSYMRDAQWNLLFKDATEGRVRSVKSFFKSAAESPFTFNVAYADNKHIATYSAGRLPLRNPHVDPRLPTKGTGEFEWTGFLPASKHAFQADPKNGLLVNWNNKPAPNWGSADDNWAYGSIYRSQMLLANLAKKRRHSLASVTSAMNAAATQDFRSVALTPLLDKVLAGSTPPSPRVGQMLAALDTWRSAGSSRLDVNLDGKADAGPGPAIWDALYPVLADAILAPALGPQNDELSRLVGRLNAPSTGFQDGRIWILDKDLKALVGEPLNAPYHTKFCGSGDKAACQATIWQAFQQAGDAIAAAQGNGDVAAWFMNANAERIKFAPGLLQTTIRYTNRPSGIQQVISFTGHRK